jgi:hypothetical protein
MGSRDFHRLRQLGAAVDYEAIAGKSIREMDVHVLQRFLVVCALVSDLYCPGFNPVWSKNSSWSLP